MALTDSTSKKSYSNSYTKNKLKTLPKPINKYDFDTLRKRLKKVLPSFEDINKKIPSKILKD